LKPSSGLIFIKLLTLSTDTILVYKLVNEKIVSIISSAKVIAYVKRSPTKEEFSLSLNIQKPIAVILIKNVINANL
jgi:hypothetical protein